jgi:L-alanine-DL-glutamate epimerase-like enolase superfamily enzyme
MKIDRISVYKVDLPYVGGEYGWGDGYVITVGETYIVRIDTDEGATGWGEVCPIGGSYLPAHPLGVPAGVAALAPYLLGMDPTNPGLIDATMDRWLLGHQYVKTPIDIACWDLAGQALGAPLHTLLGGRRNDAMRMYRVLPQGEISAMFDQLAEHRETGYEHFQVKVGGDPDHDAARLRAIVPELKPGEKVFADANRGWRRDEALKCALLTRDLFYFLEQPCTGYDDCLSVRRAAAQPMKLDESIQTLDDMIRVIRDDACDEVCVKLDRFGGLTKSRLIRDLCAARGIPMTVESSWGGKIITTAHAHLAAATPPEVLMNTTDLHNYNTVHFAEDGAQVVDGRLTVGDAPGLGVTPDMSVLGEPIAVHV